MSFTDTDTDTHTVKVRLLCTLKKKIETLAWSGEKQNSKSTDFSHWYHNIYLWCVVVQQTHIERMLQLQHQFHFAFKLFHEFQMMNCSRTLFCLSFFIHFCLCPVSFASYFFFRKYKNPKMYPKKRRGGRRRRRRSSRNFITYVCIRFCLVEKAGWLRNKFVMICFSFACILLVRSHSFLLFIYTGFFCT